MIRKRSFYIFISIFFDAIAASVTWFLFFYFRKAYIEADIFGQKNIEFNVVFYKGLFYVTLFWGFVYFLAGNYKQIWRKSRIKEFSKTFSISIIGVLLLFFALLLDDTINGYKTYYLSLFVLFLIHFSLTATERLVIASIIIKKLRKKELGFNTIVIGNNKRTLDLINELNDKNNA